MPGVTGLPLRATLARLDRADTWFSYCAGEPSSDGWIDLADLLADPAVVAGWVDELVAGEGKGHRDVAGSYLASWLGGALADSVSAALITEQRAWPVAPDAISLRRHPDGWFDGIAVRSEAVRVLHGDAAADAPGVEVVPDLATLRTHIAAELATVLAPLFAAIRARAPYGTRGMWGSTADGIAATALQRARQDGADAAAAWEDAGRLIDALEVALGAAITRPTPTEIAWSGGVATFAVRGTCCLYYKVSGHEPDPRGEAYCTSCPFRDDDDRQRRLATWLDEQAERQ